MDKRGLEIYSVKDATHVLKCRHQVCRNGFSYEMPCIILNKNKSTGNYKIVVFGERYWKRPGWEKKKRIRYVWAQRVKKMKGDVGHAKFK